VDYFTDGIDNADHFFARHFKKLWSTKYIRLLALVLNVFGFYIMFAPIVHNLTFIPLDGVLIRSSTLAVALILALAVGLTLSTLLLGLAWLLVRPQVGVPLLALTAGGLVLLFLNI